MTDGTLKSVIVLDPETQRYKPSAHNLTAAQAIDLVQTFTADGKKAKAIDQEQRHRSSNPRKCKSCKQAAEQSASQPEPDVHEDQS